MRNDSKALALGPIDARALWRRTALLAAVPVASGGLAWAVVYRQGLGLPIRGRANAFENLFLRHEPSGLGLLFTIAALLLFFAWRVGRSATSEGAPVGAAGGVLEKPGFALLIAACVLGGAWFGREHVLFGADLAMDEFASWFQARIFVEGRLSAPLPPPWAAFVPAVVPTFISFDVVSGTWASTYLPVFAFLRAAALAARAEGLLNPFFTALAIPLFWVVCRRLWPEERDCAWVGAILLATSPQVLVNAMTGYAMSVHLTANVLWLLLWLSPGRGPSLLLPVVGGLALGLHNPFPHALFVTPFLLASLRRWGIRRLAYNTVVYGLFSAGWWVWLRAFHPQATSSAGPLAIFSMPGPGQFLLQGMNLALVASWQSPVSVVLVAAALASRPRLEGPVRLAAIGFLLSFGFYMLFPLSQGHGWGYRYVHGALAGWILLAVAGYRVARDVLGRQATSRLVTGGTAAVLAVLLPIRLLQVRDFASPFAAGFQLMSSIRSEVVVVDEAAGWYAWDLIRNDPFLRSRPVVLSLRRLSTADRAKLARTVPRGVRFVGGTAMASVGLTTFPIPQAVPGSRPPVD